MGGLGKGRCLPDLVPVRKSSPVEGWQEGLLKPAEKAIPRSRLVLFALPEYAVYLGRSPVGLYLPVGYS